MEIDRCKWLVRSSGTTFESSATAIDVSQWLTCCHLIDSTAYLCLCLKRYLTIGVSIACYEFLSAQIDKILCRKAWFWRYNLWFCFVKDSTSSAWVTMKYYDRSVSVRIEAAVMRCADNIQHYLAETLAGRAKWFSYAIFSYSGRMRLLTACWCDCPAFGWQSAFLVMFLLNMRAVFMLQNLFGLGLA